MNSYFWSDFPKSTSKFYVLHLFLTEKCLCKVYNTPLFGKQQKACGADYLQSYIYIYIPISISISTYILYAVPAYIQFKQPALAVWHVHHSAGVFIYSRRSIPGTSSIALISNNDALDSRSCTYPIISVSGFCLCITMEPFKPGDLGNLLNFSGQVCSLPQLDTIFKIRVYKKSLLVNFIFLRKE